MKISPQLEQAIVQCVEEDGGTINGEKPAAWIDKLVRHTEEERLGWDEKTFQAEVIRLAKLGEWSWYHTYNSRRSVPGFPDLFLCRLEVSFFVELKTEKGKLTEEQEDWHWRMEKSGQEVMVWRPHDWDDIERILA